MKKKVIAILCTMLCGFVLSACGNNTSSGKTVVLGTYEQDNDTSNGAEPIEWQVVGTRDGHTLLLSKYVLDCKKYNETKKDITWEKCTLRSWLNNDFYNTAFSDSEKERIVTANNENPDSYNLYEPRNKNAKDDNVSTDPNRITIPDDGANGGNATDDKVFLLSWMEARDYLDGKLAENALGAGNYNRKLLCTPTEYAKVQGVVTGSNSDNMFPADTVGCSPWWLRSPGGYQQYATFATTVGSLGSSSADKSNYGVRPAILID